MVINVLLTLSLIATAQDIVTMIFGFTLERLFYDDVLTYKQLSIWLPSLLIPVMFCIQLKALLSTYFSSSYKYILQYVLSACFSDSIKYVLH